MALSAYEVNYNNMLLPVTQYDEKIHYGKITCKSCGIKMSYIHVSYRRISKKSLITGEEKQIKVRAHYKRWKGIFHEDDCDYLVGNRVEDIYAKRADNELMTKENDKYKVRIMIVKEKFLEPRREKNEKIDGREVPTPEFHYAGKKTAYISNLNRIIKLRMQLDNNKEIAEHVSLEVYNQYNRPKEIKWNQFYYSLEKYDELFKALNRTLNYDICVEGTIRNIKKLNDYNIAINLDPIIIEKKRSFEELDGNMNGVDVSKVVNEKIPIESRLEINVYCTDNKVFDLYKNEIGKRVVVYGKFSSTKKFTLYLKSHKEKETEKLIITGAICYEKVNCNIYGKEQIVIES